jgi:anion-transporting  ArsA/GET3 family ATPase
VKQLEIAEVADLIIVDAPATGHALTFLSSPPSLISAARGGPLRAQAEAVTELLSDPERCAVTIVTIPEETPVNEAVEAAFRLEDEVGVKLGPLVVNCRYPRRQLYEGDPVDAAREEGICLDPELARELASAASFGRARRLLEDRQVERLSEALPLPQLGLPALFNASFGPPQLEELADAMSSAIEAL